MNPVEELIQTIQRSAGIWVAKSNTGEGIAVSNETFLALIAGYERLEAERSVITGELERVQAELAKEREANRKMRQYHIYRIDYWKHFRKEGKDGSYSLSEACEIRIDTHQVALKMLDYLWEGSQPNEPKAGSQAHL